jgi:hydroxysqualene dehydroxylase
VSRRLAIVGAGWAGLSAAVAAHAAGHRVTLFEATRQLGGRARALAVTMPDRSTLRLDNGQHIMVGAYRETLRMLRAVGVDPERVLLRLPLALRFPDGAGLALPAWPAPFDAAAGVLRARGWGWADKWSLVRSAARWRASGFECAPATTVTSLCAQLTPVVMTELVEPLCVSALNTPAPRASGQVFLRVLRDTLFEPQGSNLLLPRCDLGALFPERASAWLRERGVAIELAHRTQQLAPDGGSWLVDGERFDAVLLACPPADAARLIANCGIAAAAWLELAGALRYEAIATVYASGATRLPAPMLALRSDARRPAQFVFDRAQLGGPQGLLAFVVSACDAERDAMQDLVMAQAHELGWAGLLPVQTVVERRATFACTPGLVRPPASIAPGLLACGDYVAGPYPATLEGAVRSATAAVALMG